MALMLKKPRTRAPWGEYVGIGPLSIEAFDSLPLVDGWEFELHEGSLVRMPGPGKIHALMTARLNIIMQAYLADKQLGVLLGTNCYIFNAPVAGRRLTVS